MMEVLNLLGESWGLKPRLFIISSVESLAIANAIHDSLTYDAQYTIQSKGVSKLSTSMRSIRPDKISAGAFIVPPADYPRFVALCLSTGIGWIAAVVGIAFCGYPAAVCHSRL